MKFKHILLRSLFAILALQPIVGVRPLCAVDFDVSAITLSKDNITILAGLAAYLVSAAYGICDRQQNYKRPQTCYKESVESWLRTVCAKICITSVALSKAQDFLKRYNLLENSVRLLHGKTIGGWGVSMSLPPIACMSGVLWCLLHTSDMERKGFYTGLNPLRLIPSFCGYSLTKLLA